MLTSSVGRNALPNIASSRTSTGGITGTNPRAVNRSSAWRTSANCTCTMSPSRYTNREPLARAARSPSSMPSRSPSSAWSLGSKSKVGGSPWRRTSTASSSVNPSGADSWGTFGVRASRSASSAWTCSRRGSSSLSSAETLAASAIRRCFSSPWAPPIALLVRFCSARSSSTWTVSARRRSSSSRIVSTASARWRRARPLRNRSGSSRIARTSSTLDLGLRGLGRRALRRGRGGLLRLGRLLIHDRLPLEDPALLDDEGLRGDVAVHAPAPGELGPSLDEDRALEPAGDHDVLRADVRLDLALRGQQDVALGVDLPPHLPVDPQRPGGHDRALELGSLPHDGDLSALLICHPSHLRPSRIRPGRLVPLGRTCVARRRGEIARGRYRVVPSPDQVADTARSAPGSSACRIASSSSMDRL